MVDELSSMTRRLPFWKAMAERRRRSASPGDDTEPPGES